MEKIISFKYVIFSKLLFLTNVFLFATILSYGQVGQESISPNLFKGTANISIPLVSKSVDGINTSVSLSYNTGGIKIDRIASTVGLGWELNTSAILTRQVKGLPDEHYRTTPIQKGYWHRDNVAVSIGSNQARHDILDKKLDGESDIFSVSVGGQQMSFSFDCNDHIMKFPSNSKLKIERIYNNNSVSSIPKTSPCTNLEFKVTDASGNQFFFKPGDQKRLFTSYNYSYSYADFSTSTWVIDKIITYNGREVNYEYIYSVEDASTTPVYTSYKEEVYLVDVDIATNDCNIRKAVEETEEITRHCMIKEIVYPDSKVTFEYFDEGVSQMYRADCSGSYALKKITVEGIEDMPAGGTTTSPTKRYLWFDMAYFNTQTSANYSYKDSAEFSYKFHTTFSPTINGEIQLEWRLKLKNIKSSTDNAGMNKKLLYDFEYHDLISLNVQNNALRLGAKKDYWGYFTNMQSTNLTNTSSSVNYLFDDCVPLINFDVTAQNCTIGIDRNPTTKNKLFSLKKIKNEAGGVTEFEYGLHTINHGGGTINLDGLRLDKIITKDENNFNLTTHIKEFLYENGEWQLPMTTLPNDPIELFEYIKTFSYQGPPGGGAPPVYTHYNRNTISNLAQPNLSGSQHGYGKVTVFNKVFYPTQNWVSTLSLDIEEQTGKSEHFFSTLRAVSSQIHLHDDVEAGTSSYTSTNSNNYIINLAPPSNHISCMPGIPNDPYDIVKIHSKWAEEPYTDKNDAIDWAVGLPIKTLMYDANNELIKESETQYDIYVHAMNTANFLNVKTDTGNFISPAPPPSPVCTNCSVPNLLVSDYYFPITGRVEVKEQKSKSYLNSTVFKEGETKLFYNDSLDLFRKVSQPDLSQPDEIVEQKLFYSYDNANWSADPLMTTLENQGITSVVFSETWQQKTGQTSLHLVSASGAGFGQFNGKIKPKMQYATTLSEPTSSISTGSFDLTTANSGAAIPNYTPSGEITKYDEHGNVLEAQSDGIYGATIWDEDLDIPIAEINNADYSEVAYCSFESIAYGSDPLASNYLSRNKGSWNFDHINVTSNNAGVTGEMNFNLGTSLDKNIWTNANVNLNPNKTYVLTYWAKNGANVTVRNEYFHSNGQGTGVALNPMAIRQLNGWTFYRAEFQGAYPDMRISGTGSIDELRLHPIDAQMTTKVVKPLLGVLSICDANNRTIHYEYDEWGRLLLTKDEEGNILSKKMYGINTND